MTTVILVAIGILLAAAAALMVAFYGGDAFTGGSVKAEAASLQNLGLNVQSASQGYVAQTGALPDALSDLDGEGDDQWLADGSLQVPEDLSTPEIAREDGLLVFRVAGVADGVCRQVNANYGRAASIPAAIGSLTHGCRSGAGGNAFFVVLSRAGSGSGGSPVEPGPTPTPDPEPTPPADLGSWDNFADFYGSSPVFSYASGSRPVAGSGGTRLVPGHPYLGVYNNGSVVFVHPEQDGNDITATFTAPQAGTYRFTGYFQTGGNCGNGTVVTANGRTEVTFGNLVPFDFTLALSTGQGVPFEVSAGGEQGCDSTVIPIVARRIS